MPMHLLCSDTLVVDRPLMEEHICISSATVSTDEMVARIEEEFSFSPGLFRSFSEAPIASSPAALSGDEQDERCEHIAEGSRRDRSRAHRADDAARQCILVGTLIAEIFPPLMPDREFTFFDVGVGRGDWSRYLLEMFPRAKGGGLTLWLGSLSNIGHGQCVSPSVYKPYSILTYAARSNWRFLINYGDVTHPSCLRLHRPELLPAPQRRQMIEDCYTRRADLVLCDAFLARPGIGNSASPHEDFVNAREPFSHKPCLANGGYRFLPALEIANAAMMMANVRVMLKKIDRGGALLLHLYNCCTPLSLDIVCFLVSLFSSARVVVDAPSEDVGQLLEKGPYRMIPCRGRAGDMPMHRRGDLHDLDVYLCCNDFRLSAEEANRLAALLFEINLRGHDTSFVTFLSPHARLQTMRVRDTIKQMMAFVMSASILGSREDCSSTPTHIQAELPSNKAAVPCRELWKRKVSLSFLHAVSFPISIFLQGHGDDISSRKPALSGVSGFPLIGGSGFRRIHRGQ